MDKTELDKLIEKYKQEMLDMAKASTNINQTEYKQIPDDNNNDEESEIEGEVVYPTGENINNETVYDEVMTATQNSENETQDYLNFMQENPKQGELKIQAYTARQAMPVSGVLIEISKKFNGVKKLFYSLKTDQSGIIDGIFLPAPDKKISQTPSNLKTFASYDIQATHPGYTEKNYLNVPIFDGVKSIQPIDLIPIEEKDTSTKEE